MIKTKHKTQPKQTKETKQPKEPKQPKQQKQPNEPKQPKQPKQQKQPKQTKQQKQTKKNKETKKPKKIYKGGNNSTVAFTYQIKDINSAINKYEIIFIERQEKLLHLCNNFINKLKASEGSLNNKYKIFSYSTKYDKSRYLTLINKEFYENIFKNYFIPILQIINKDNIVTEQNDLNKIAEYLNFITDDDVDTNDEKRKKINRDFQIFEKYVSDDNIDEVELKKDVENTLGKLKNLMATTNFDKDKIIDIKDLKEKIDIINNKIDKWKPPSWQDILLSTFDSDIETINKKGLHKYSKIYIDAIDNFVSIGGSDLNDYDEKSISKIKNEIEKALKKIRELKEDENNEKDTAELLNIVLINIKKLLLNLINKNYTKNISSIQKLKQYCKKETAEIDKYIDNYKIKLDEFSMQKSSSIPEEPKKENIEKPQVPKNEQKETFDSPLFTPEDVERIRTTKGALEFWKTQGIVVNPKDIKAELSPDRTYVTTYWNSPLNNTSKNEQLAELIDNKFYLNGIPLEGQELFKYAKDIKDKRVFKTKTIINSEEEKTIIENESTSSGVPATRTPVGTPTGTPTGTPVGTPVGTPTGTQAEAPGAPAAPAPAPGEAPAPEKKQGPAPGAPGTGTNGFGLFGNTQGSPPAAPETTPVPAPAAPAAPEKKQGPAEPQVAQRVLEGEGEGIGEKKQQLTFPTYDPPDLNTQEMKKIIENIIKYVSYYYNKSDKYPPEYQGPFLKYDYPIPPGTPINLIIQNRDEPVYIQAVGTAWTRFFSKALGGIFIGNLFKYNTKYNETIQLYNVTTKLNLQNKNENIKSETERILKNIKDGKEWLDDSYKGKVFDDNYDEYRYDRTFNTDKSDMKISGFDVKYVNKYGYPLIIAYKRCINLIEQIKTKNTFNVANTVTAQTGAQQRGTEYSPIPQSLSINKSTIGADATSAPQIKKEGFISKVKSAFRNAINEQVDDGIRYQIEQDEKDDEKKRLAAKQYIRTAAARASVKNGVTYVYDKNGVVIAKQAYAGGGNNKKNTRKVSISKESKYKVCGYVTDVEGNMDYFNKYVKISKILEWTNDKKNRLRFKKDDSIFVYGGDTQDKGHADIRFVNILLKFKEDYPDRVIFIIGNRDANKLRIPSELFETYKNEKIFLKKYDNYPYWIDSDKRITLKKYLKENNYELNIKNRLKYIIESNMGFQDGFEKRRTELSIILKKNISKITDTDVISSFVNSVMPFPENIELSNDNYILKYLMKGQIAYIFGEHIFVHGAINEYNIGQIPKNKNKIDDVNIWVNELNSWFHKELNEYINNPTVGGITKKRKAYNIIDYVIPKEKSISVVHANNLKNGNGKHINKNVSKILNKYGIKNIITGHKPHGDCPLVIRDKNITAISADTSYSNVNYLREKNKIEGDNRGNAVSEVLLYSNGYIRIHGKYANNTKYSYLLKERANEKNMELNDYIGMQLNNKYWIKNIKKDKFLISYGKDYELYEKWISLKEVKELLK